nr:MAG TPA: hypothetical protein [Caudoviricetes sp.]
MTLNHQYDIFDLDDLKSIQRGGEKIDKLKVTEGFD